ncbi:hypothetical protein VTI74DRAFT_11103 [Chaetomium olivicolor]
MFLAFSASSSLDGWRPLLTICWCQSRTSFSTSGQLPKRRREPDSWVSPSRRAYLGESECETVDCEMVWLYWFWNQSMHALWLGRTGCELAQRRRARRWSRVSEWRSFGGVATASGTISSVMAAISDAVRVSEARCSWRVNTPDCDYEAWCLVRTRGNRICGKDGW